jgi:hypothetical protein
MSFGITLVLSSASVAAVQRFRVMSGHDYDAIDVWVGFALVVHAVFARLATD